MDALLGMLAPDVVLHGRRRQGAGDREAAGRATARHAAARRSAPPGLDPRRLPRVAWVNGQPGAVMYDTVGRVVGVVERDVADGVVQTIRAVANPDKLGHIGPVSDVARLPD